MLCAIWSMLLGSSCELSECPLLLQAFGAVGTFETALFRVLGEQRLLSEQNMMDCAWDTGNTACMGGYQVSPPRCNRQLPSSQDEQACHLWASTAAFVDYHSLPAQLACAQGRFGKCPGVSCCSSCTGPVWTHHFIQQCLHQCSHCPHL